MTFTYALSSSNADDVNISQVRMELGDTVFQSGVKPDGSNFDDAEIATWLEQESDDIMHTVIRACLALSRLWTNVANITVGPRREELGKVADGWLMNAKSLSEQYGSPAGGGSAFAVASDRVDGYSEHADESESL